MTHFNAPVHSYWARPAFCEYCRASSPAVCDGSCMTTTRSLPPDRSRRFVGHPNKRTIKVKIRICQSPEMEKIVDMAFRPPGQRYLLALIICLGGIPALFASFRTYLYLCFLSYPTDHADVSCQRFSPFFPLLGTVHTYTSCIYAIPLHPTGIVQTNSPAHRRERWGVVYSTASA